MVLDGVETIPASPAITIINRTNSNNNNNNTSPPYSSCCLPHIQPSCAFSERHSPLFCPTRSASIHPRPPQLPSPTTPHTSFACHTHIVPTGAGCPEYKAQTRRLVECRKQGHPQGLSKEGGFTTRRHCKTAARERQTTTQPRQEALKATATSTPYRHSSKQWLER